MAFVKEKIPEYGPERRWLNSMGWLFADCYIELEGHWLIDRERGFFCLSLKEG